MAVTSLQEGRMSRFPRLLDPIIDWARSHSLWPMYFGLSCCFIEEVTTLTPRYDLARFGAEVMRLSPRQADLMIISGTVFKKVAPVVRRLYEQTAAPVWVISMGSCSNTGGMYDTYSVVQGINQILPVDVYIPGCPPRPEAVLAGLTALQEKMKRQEQPTRRIFSAGGGTQGTETAVLTGGVSKFRDPRGPGMTGIPIRGDSVTPPGFADSRCDLMWTPPARRISLGPVYTSLLEQVRSRFGDAVAAEDACDMLTLTVPDSRLCGLLSFLKAESDPAFSRLEDLTAVDESARRNRDRYPDFTMVYHLTDLKTAKRVRVKTPLWGKYPKVPSICRIWPAADWYEREVYEMFGVDFAGHPDLRRLILPVDWRGYPLRKTYPWRATDHPPYTEADARNLQPMAGEDYFPGGIDDESMVLNIGPHHTATHGLLRVILRLKSEQITGIDIDIGYHHRSVEKIGERQHWIQFTPYTDRVDYFAGAANNLPYVRALEQLAGIEVPDRAQCIRVLLSEIYRLSNHLSFLGIMGHDLGAMTPNFYTYRDRERLMDIAEMITGARLHPAWFRPGGVVDDLPRGWKEPINDFLEVFPDRLKDYETLTAKNPIFKARTKGIGRMDAAAAVDWGITGPNLRASGVSWDLRKDAPYAAYEQFDFEVPTSTDGDCLARYVMRLEECRQSAAVLRQVIDHMPAGRYITGDYRYAVPRREDMLKDIESLIHHFINVTRGPKFPVGESYAACEIPRGEQGYYAVSDGLGTAYRMRIRAPSFPIVRSLRELGPGNTIPDFVSILGSLDYTMPDLDR